MIARLREYGIRLMRAAGRPAAVVLLPLRRQWPLLVWLTVLGAMWPLWSIWPALRGDSAPWWVFAAMTSVLRSFAVAYAVSWLVMWRPMSWLRVPVVVVASVVGIAVFVTRAKWGLGISPTLVGVVSGTSVSETREFFGSVSWWLIGAYVAAVAAVVCGYLFAARRCSRRNGRMEPCRRLNIAAAAVVVVAVATGMAKFAVVGNVWSLPDRTRFDMWASEWGWTWTIPMDIYTASAITLRHMAYGSEQWEQLILEACRQPVSNTVAAADSLHVVLVIGESYQRGHSQLYGYQMPTTPRMAAERDSGRLVVFEDYASVEPHTIEAVNNMLSLNRVSADEAYSGSVFFPVLFRCAGWDVVFFEHQNVPNYSYDMFLHNQLFNPLLDRCCWSARVMSNWGKGLCDGDYLDVDWARADTLSLHAPHRFEIYQLMGQHLDYSDRYPASFARFSDADYGWRQEPWLDSNGRRSIAAYDNATLYNDFVMGRIFDRYRHANAVVVYIPDHGEEVYDYRNTYGRDQAARGQERQWIDCQLRVPMTVWMSDRYAALYPARAEALRAAASRVGSSDDIGHMLLSLAGLHTGYYVAERDIMSDAYKAPHRVSLVTRQAIEPLAGR